MLFPRVLVAALSSCALPMVWAVPAFAQADITGGSTQVTDPAPASMAGAEPQDSAAPLGDGEIIVTARRRDERLIDVPVAVSALDEGALNRYGSQTMTTITRLVPELQITKATAGSGGSIAIRGVSSPSQDAGIEQTVSINIDNVPISRGRVAQQGLFDLGSLQVLKGPQALFFGKNSPAGVVVIDSKNPGSTLEGYVRSAYEFNAREGSIEGAIGGPLSDTVGMRVAARGSKMWGGYIKNTARPIQSPFPGENFLIPGGVYNDLPGGEEILGRITLEWKPTADFTARLKVFGSDFRDRGDASTFETLSCGGRPNTDTRGVVDPFSDCELNGKQSRGALPIEIARQYPGSNNGIPFSHVRVFTPSLTLQYNMEHVSLTSVTGFFRIASDNFDNTGDNNVWGQLTAGNNERTSTFTQEFRLSTSLDGPLNFNAGLYFEKSRRRFDNYGKILPLGVDPVTGYRSTWIQNDLTKSTTYSGYLSASYNILENLELSGGARITREEKDGTLMNSYVHAGAKALFLPQDQVIAARFRDTDISPEVTLSWHPVPRSTIYASYKTGYKSGGIPNQGTLGPLPPGQTDANYLVFGPESVEGFEVGSKGQFGSLTATLTAYRFIYDGLQQSALDPVTIAYRTLNAAKAKVQGIEGQLSVRASSALSLRGAANYNHATFTDFPNAQCFLGQTVAEGCVGNTQNVRGKSLPRAPRWSATAGVTLEQPISNAYKLEVNGDAKLSSGYYLGPTLSPFSYQKSWQVFNASIRLTPLDGLWEIGFVANNIFNKYYGIIGGDQPGGSRGDSTAAIARPQELILQLGLKF